MNLLQVFQNSITTFGYSQCYLYMCSKYLFSPRNVFNCALKHELTAVVGLIARRACDPGLVSRNGARKRGKVPSALRIVMPKIYQLRRTVDDPDELLLPMARDVTRRCVSGNRGRLIRRPLHKLGHHTLDNSMPPVSYVSPRVSSFETVHEIE